MTTHDDQTPSYDHSGRRVHATAGADEQWSRRNGLWIAPAFDRLLCENHLDSLDALFANPIGERLDKPGLPTWRQRWQLTLRDPPDPPLCKGGTTHQAPTLQGGEVGPRRFYLKRFSDPPASARREVRRSGTGAKSVAGLELAWMNRLTRDGVPCVQPVAVGEEVRGSREVRSAMLTAAVPGDSLERWAAQWTRADRATVRALIGVLAKLVARLHAGGYVHRDLYLAHIFFDPAAPLADSLCLIDLQRMIRPALNLRRWIVKDLAALNYSASPTRGEATPYPSPTRGEATSLPSPTRGEATPYPSPTRGEATPYPSPTRGDATSLPSPTRGEATSLPSPTRGDATSLPSPTRGDATGPSDLVSRTDRLRWLKLYLGAVKLDGSARRLAYRVIGKTLRIQRRDARRRLREHIG